MRLTYANVVSTLALFVALGGASYAAVELPTGSVGSKQLKAKSVTPENLSFPLGAVGTTDWTKDELGKLDGCNAPREPGVVGVIACPKMEAESPRRASPAGSAVPVQAIRLSGHAQVLVGGVAQLRNKGPDGTWASVTAVIVVDDVVIARPKLDIEGNSTTEMPLDGVVDVGPGVHHFVVTFHAEYGTYLPGKVLVDPITLWAEALPR
jgi:hypothetical protein